MQVMGISGLPGSGKGLVSDMATERGAIIVSMGDIIREEAKKRGESTKETAKNLRKEKGEYIVSELTIKKIKQLEKEGIENAIVVDGIRSHHEVEMFKENFDDFIILSIFAKKWKCLRKTLMISLFFQSLQIPHYVLKDCKTG